MDFECPQCEGVWDGLDEWEEENVDLDQVYENLEGTEVPDPPLDSLVALLSTALEFIAEEIASEGDESLDATLEIHCTVCAVEMVWNERIPAFNYAFVAGAKLDPDDMNLVEGAGVQR